MTASPASVYEQNISLLSDQQKALRSRMSLIAWSRLLVVVMLILLCWYLRSISLFSMILAGLILLALFLRLVIIAGRYKAQLRNTDLLLQINLQELEIAAGQYIQRPDGAQFMPPLHDFASDLDLFGRASLYQYINRTTSEQGNLTISQWLLSPSDVDTVMERQEAARELAPAHGWRQQFQAHGMLEKVKTATEEKIGRWLKEKNQFMGAQWKLFRFSGPAFMLGATACWAADLLSTSRLLQFIALFFILSSLISRKVTLQYLQLDKIVPEINTLLSVVQWIESAQWKSTLLLHAQRLCTSRNEQPASAEINKLKSILNRLEYRMNPMVFLPLNIFLFWDLQQVLALEQWKTRNGETIDGWFKAMQTVEALSTLATLHFNHPGWTYPVFVPEEGALEVTDAGHPLIAQNKRVTSSFSTTGLGKIALITGSNMAGKSTFLRSIGINLVLAMMGAPVCATGLRLAPLRVISSMRVTDNLEENTSTFYAELKKLRHIIEEVNKKEKVFLLLDEILRGTNSLDRHTGSKALVEQLIRRQATGIVATHDIELAALHNTVPHNITNYHFDVQVANDELYFDYRLKEGVCQSLNASILMKKIGIEF